jgi:hypothetical protein
MTRSRRPTRPLLGHFRCSVSDSSQRARSRSAFSINNFSSSSAAGLFNFRPKSQIKRLDHKLPNPWLFAGPWTSAAILVPYGQLHFLAKKVADYANPAKDGKERKDGTRSPRNASLLNNIALIGVAALEALWTDPEPIPTNNDPGWWEMWIRRDDAGCENRFDTEQRRLGLVLKEPRLKLPDPVVVIVKASRSQIEGSLDLLNTLAEVRKPRACNLGLTELRGPDQREWIQEALERIKWPSRDSPAVCLIDSGVNRGHPLLEPILDALDMSTVVPQHGTADHANPALAHGTAMVGVAAFGDLRNLLISTTAWNQTHRLESVK